MVHVGETLKAEDIIAEICLEESYIPIIMRTIFPSEPQRLGRHPDQDRNVFFFTM